jgi:hypothetical protein
MIATFITNTLVTVVVLEVVAVKQPVCLFTFVVAFKHPIECRLGVVEVSVAPCA